MPKLSRIEKFLSDYLRPDQFIDPALNGAQVTGRDEIKRIVTGVSACLELFERAAEIEADMIIVHHGLFFGSNPTPVKGSFKARLKFLLEREINLFGYHLPLDAHPQIGNNAQLAKTLKLRALAPFGIYKGQPIGTHGSREDGDPDSLFELVRGKINPDARIYRFGSGPIEKVGLVSGAGADSILEAVEKNLDILITGEESEWVYNFAREEKIDFIAAGHHATERFGVRELARALSERFDVDARFIDIHNPI